MRIEYRVGDISRRGGVLFNLELVSESTREMNRFVGTCIT